MSFETSKEGLLWSLWTKHSKVALDTVERRCNVSGVTSGILQPKSYSFWPVVGKRRLWEAWVLGTMYRYKGWITLSPAKITIQKIAWFVLLTIIHWIAIYHVDIVNHLLKLRSIKCGHLFYLTLTKKWSETHDKFFMWIFIYADLEGSGLGHAQNWLTNDFNLISMLFSFSGLQSENTSLKVENVDLTGG